MRSACILLLLAAVAAADRARLDDAQRAALVAEVGSETWAAMPPWRQRMLEQRYARFLGLPAEKQQEVRARGLREFLVGRERDVDARRLPPPLQEEIGRLPEPVRAQAVRLAFFRMRQLQFDRSLESVPAERRWDVFRRRFPEPYDHAEAKAGHEELKAWTARAVARRIAKRIEERHGDLSMPEAEARRLKEELFLEEARQEQERIVERIRREFFRARTRDARAWRRTLESQGFELLERLPFVTPRQRELVRYALHPRDCPLLDLGFLGPRPDDPEARRQWEWDTMVLGRVELLLEADFRPEQALHLAGAGSPAELLRALKRLRTAAPGRPGPDPLLTAPEAD